ncbi:MAG: outer membrane protein transport protein [Polyangiaceae bacterium]|nr:outer membrane protein transport protein [Polyangiaceae bacterium]
MAQPPRPATLRSWCARRALACSALAAAALGSASPARAAGLYFSDRGVRPLGRGGAFVAGADDGGAVTYNPAGLAFAGNQLLADFSWLQYSSTYQRKTIVRQVDPNTGQPTGFESIQTFPEVEGTSPVLPIPTLVYSHPIGDLVVAPAVWAPYAAITSYPERVGGQPAPQRYSLITLDGSALAVGGLYAAYRFGETLAIGAGVEALAGYFQTSVAFSACVPDRFLCAPEQPDYDAYSQLRVGPIVAPSGILGATWVASDALRVGASFHLPSWIDAPATVDVRLPTASVFDGARQDGNRGRVAFELPWIARAGVEVRPAEALRVEAAFVYEAWSVHDSIRLEPEGVALLNVQAFPERYSVAPIELPRGFQDAWSVRVGAEYGFELEGYRLVSRAGVNYEKSAIPPEYLSVTTVDLDKVTLAIGGGLHIGRWRFDAVVGQVLGAPQKVDPRRAAIAQVNPVQANPSENPNIVNGGSYGANAGVFGVGLVYQLDSPEEPKTKPGG